SALKELQDATSEAVNLLSSDCPTYRALTPVGRLQAMEQRSMPCCARCKPCSPHSRSSTHLWATCCALVRLALAERLRRKADRIDHYTWRKHFGGFRAGQRALHRGHLERVAGHF